MPRHLPGGGSGGGSLTLGPSTNTFNGATRAAAEAARDAYAAANASWLAQYDASPTFTITLTWPVIPTNTVYQSRRGAAWADVTGLVRGPAGSPDTAAQVLTKLLTVDGAGSGLDADLLDGMTPAEVAALGTGTGGFTLRFGAGVPAAALGDNGDWYINTTIGGWYSKASGAWTLRYTDQTGSGGGLTTAQVNALIAAGITDTALATDATTESTTVAASRQAIAEALALKASLAGATFTGAVEVGSPSGGPLTVQGENAGNSTIMKIFTPDSGSQKAFGAGREGEFDWVQFAGEIVAGKPGFALGPGTARDTNLYREDANILKTDDAFVAEGTVTGATPTDDEHLTTKAYVDAAIAALSPTQTHLNYIAISADNAFGAAEFTDAGTGANSMTPSLVVPTFSGVQRFIAIAVPDAQDDITDILQGGVGTFGAWTRIAGTIIIGGEAHKVWRTVDSQNDLASGLTYVIVQ